MTDEHEESEIEIVAEAEAREYGDVLRESVAAHQAECGCHPAGERCCEEAADKFSELPLQLTQVDDSSGRPWHIFPLCKVRPEATLAREGMKA